MALSRPITPEDRTRFARLGLVIIEELTPILRDVLEMKIPSTQIFNEVKKVKSLFKKLRQDQILAIQNSHTVGYKEFDITLLYTLLRNLCPNISPPSQGWGTSEMPAQGETTLGDDVERIRLIRNKVYGHISRPLISETEFRENLSIILDICNRMQTLLGKNYVQSLRNAEVRTIDSEMENRYIEKIKDNCEAEKSTRELLERVHVTAERLHVIAEKAFTSQETVRIEAKNPRKRKNADTFTDTSIFILNTMVSSINEKTSDSQIEELYETIEEYVREDEEECLRLASDPFFEELRQKIATYANLPEKNTMKILSRFLQFIRKIKRKYNAIVDCSKGSLLLNLTFFSKQGYDRYRQDLERGEIGRQILLLLLYPPYLECFDLLADDLMIYLNNEAITEKADETTRKLNEKEKLWKQLKKNLKALKEPRNVLLLGPPGVGKSSFINSAITALTGKYDYYADIGSGSKHVTTTFHRISRDEYWNPDDEADDLICLPTFIDIIGLDAQLSTSNEDEDTVNSKLMNLIINGKVPDNCDLLDVSKKLKDGKELKDRKEEKNLTVDMVVVVISAESPSIPQTLVDEIYTEANVKRKKIPVFAVLTKVDKCSMSEQELEDKKTEICDAICRTPDKLLLCRNYQPKETPDIETDNRILEFMVTLCNPRFKAITIEKVEFEEPAPPPPPPPSPKPTKQNMFSTRALQLAFVVVVVAFFLYLILQILSKENKYKQNMMSKTNT